MNIEDVKEIPKDLTWEDIFATQTELSKKYHEIEGRPEFPDLNTKGGQAVVKDFLWRIIEEVGEALDSNLGIDHQREELADALHFLIELVLITGNMKAFEEQVSYVNWGSRFTQEEWSSYVSSLVRDAARVGRTCKNKPWKQSEIPIDREEFKKTLIGLCHRFLLLAECAFDSRQQMFEFYYKKSQVNHFRIRSKY